MEFAISDEENLDNAESLAALSELNLYLDTPKAVLKVLKHFLRFAEITASVSLGGLIAVGPALYYKSQQNAAVPYELVT